MARISFHPIRIRRLSEIIEYRIKDSILKGEIKPGQRLPVEKEISKQFGVSVVTAREALRSLEIFGFIERRKGKGGGVFIKEVKSDSVKLHLYDFLSSKKFSARDLSELRMIIEPAAVRIAASQITSHEIAALGKNVRYCERKIKKAEGAFSERDFVDIREKNIEFHSMIAEATHNPVLALTIEYVVDFYKTKSFPSPDIQYSIEITRDHRKILSHLKKGDAQGAEKEMLAHLKKVEEYLASKEAQS